MTGRDPEIPTKRQPRRAKQARAKATVDAILEAATQILGQYGWSGFTTNRVAVRAGVSIGSVYEYFENKDAIITALIDRHLTDAQSSLADTARTDLSTASIEDIINVLVDGYIALHADHPQFHHFLSSEIALTADVRERVDGLVSQVEALVSTALTGKTSDPELKARIVVTTVDALTHRWAANDDGTPRSDHEIAAELKSMLTAYLSR